MTPIRGLLLLAVFAATGATVDSQRVMVEKAPCCDHSTDAEIRILEKLNRADRRHLNAFRGLSYQSSLRSTRCSGAQWRRCLPASRRRPSSWSYTFHRKCSKHMSKEDTRWGRVS